MKKLIAIMALLIMVASVAPVLADLTMDEKLQVNMGSKKMVIFKMDLYGNYDAHNGQVLDFTQYGFVHVDSVDIAPRRGTSFDYNYDDKIVRLWNSTTEFTHAASMVTLTDIKVKVIGY